MVTRTIQVYDNDLMTVAAGSPSLTPGSTIINNSDTPNGTIFKFGGGTPVTITLDDTSANTAVLEDDLYGKHTITNGGGLVATGKGVESESLIYVRSVDASGNPTGPTITIVVFSQGNVAGDIWGFHSDIPLTAGRDYVKTAGNNIGTASYSSIATQPVCFAQGTLIDTPNGPTAVENLHPGDLVWTLDHGPVPIRWMQQWTEPLQSADTGNKPVLIAAGALGDGFPTGDLIVSPQHRILVGGHGQLQSHFPSEAFAPAKSLTGLRGLRHMKGKKRITWFHFACDQHEVVLANGCLTESLLLGPMAVDGMTDPDRQTVKMIFGASLTPDAALNGPPARECLAVGAVRRHLAKGVEKRRELVAEETRKWHLDRALEQSEADWADEANPPDAARLKGVA